MAHIVRLPKLGLSDRGEIVEWRVSSGEAVEEGETIAVLESEKSAVDIEAPSGGVFLGTYVTVGEEIEIEPGRPIAAIGEKGEELPILEDGASDSETTEQTTPDEPKSPSLSSSGTPSKVTPKARVVAEKHDVDLEGVTPTGPEASITAGDVQQFVGDSGSADTSDTAATHVSDESVSDTAGDEVASDMKATPKAKKLARTEGVNLAVVEGTGPKGAITNKDVQHHLSGDEKKSEPRTERDKSDEEFTISSVRDRSKLEQTMANRLSQSAREKPHARGNRQVNIEPLDEMADEMSDDSHHISVNDLLLHAVVLTLEKHPKFNAVFTEGEHRLVEQVNVGYAVDSEDGLVVPVLKHADEYAVADLATQRRQIVDNVLQGNHEPADLQDGTFTISNIGVLGMDSAFSLINPPQVAILAVGRRRPMLFESSDDVTTATGVELSLIIDHRVLDGGDAGQFLQTLSSYIEQPARMLRDASR